jgi:hypothetical protein
MLALLLSVAVWAASPIEVMKQTEHFRTHRVGAIPPISQAEYAKAIAGRVATGVTSVPGYAAKKGYGLLLTDLPIERLWWAVNDDRGKVKWTKLAYAEVYDGRYCASERRVFQYLPVPLVTDRWWVLDIHENLAMVAASGGRVREMVFKSVDDAALPTESMRAWSQRGMRVAFIEGAWYLHALGENSTLIEYYTWSDPGGSVPAGLASSFSTSSIANAIESMVRLARAGSTCDGRL